MAAFVVKNASKLMAIFSHRRGALPKAVARGTTKAAMILQKRAREKVMKGPKSGKRYGRHTASAPGEAPANETGNLQRSITVVAAKAGPNPEARVVVNAEYAKALEYGTKKAGKSRNVKIEERPFIRPSIKEMSDAMNKAIQDEVAKG